MRKQARSYFKFCLEASNREIDNCDLLMTDCLFDAEALEVIRRVQAKYEAVKDELEDAITRLR